VHRIWIMPERIILSDPHTPIYGAVSDIASL
jgi:hypothetical protein